MNTCWPLNTQKMLMYKYKEKQRTLLHTTIYFDQISMHFYQSNHVYLCLVPYSSLCFLFQHVFYFFILACLLFFNTILHQWKQSSQCILEGSGSLSPLSRNCFKWPVTLDPNGRGFSGRCSPAPTKMRPHRTTCQEQWKESRKTWSVCWCACVTNRQWEMKTKVHKCMNLQSE